ncbi:unnamed protein product [Boreogadus saida]
MGSVVWVNTLQVQVQVPACTANKKGVPPGFKSVLVVMRSVVWVNTLQVQVRVPARAVNKKLRCRFEAPHARLIRREYPQGARGLWVNTLQVQVRVPARTANKKLSVLGVMESVVWVNTLQVQVRVPACTANKEGVPPGCKRVLVVMRSVVWVKTLQVQVRVPARMANKKLRYLSFLLAVRAGTRTCTCRVFTHSPYLDTTKSLTTACLEVILDFTIHMIEK